MNLVEGQRYQVTVARTKTREATYEDVVYVGREQGWSVFELGSGVRLRVADEVLGGAEPTL